MKYNGIQGGGVGQSTIHKNKILDKQSAPLEFFFRFFLHKNRKKIKVKRGESLAEVDVRVLNLVSNRREEDTIDELRCTSVQRYRFIAVLCARTERKSLVEHNLNTNKNGPPQNVAVQTKCVCHA